MAASAVLSVFVSSASKLVKKVLPYNMADNSSFAVNEEEMGPHPHTASLPKAFLAAVLVFAQDFFSVFCIQLFHAALPALPPNA